jgi:hypothetical protein
VIVITGCADAYMRGDGDAFCAEDIRVRDGAISPSGGTRQGIKRRL